MSRVHAPLLTMLAVYSVHNWHSELSIAKGQCPLNHKHAFWQLVMNFIWDTCKVTHFLEVHFYSSIGTQTHAYLSMHVQASTYIWTYTSWSQTRTLDNDSLIIVIYSFMISYSEIITKWISIWVTALPFPEGAVQGQLYALSRNEPDGRRQRMMIIIISKWRHH